MIGLVIISQILQIFVDFVIEQRDNVKKQSHHEILHILSMDELANDSKFSEEATTLKQIDHLKNSQKKRLDNLIRQFIDSSNQYPTEGYMCVRLDN